jgi:preprotein translocase subunit YajC
VEGLAGLLPFVLIAVIFWLLLIRPQRRRQMELVRTQQAVQVGDEVMLGAGIVGTVADAGEEYLQLEISPGVQIQVARGAVVRVLTPHDVPDHPEPGVDPGADPGTNPGTNPS